MKKKTLTLIVSIVLSIMFVSTAVIPVEVFAATTSKTTTAAKKSTKKTTTKKKKTVVKKKSVDLNPPLITLATAPHSPKPVSKTKKKKTTKKAVVKKKK